MRKRSHSRAAEALTNNHAAFLMVLPSKTPFLLVRNKRINSAPMIECLFEIKAAVMQLNAGIELLVDWLALRERTLALLTASTGLRAE